jgi:CCR4-NOT transcription complex subunit 7/8
MAPPRYGNQAMNAPYHIQQNHLQSHGTSHQHGALPPPPTHLGTPSFGAGGSSSASPFALAGNLNNGFDRSMLEAGLLPSQMAQMGFTRGGPVQGHQTFDGLGGPLDNKDDARIRNVWKHNLKDEMETLRRLVDTYPYIAMVGYSLIAKVSKLR